MIATSLKGRGNGSRLERGLGIKGNCPLGRVCVCVCVCERERERERRRPSDITVSRMGQDGISSTDHFLSAGLVVALVDVWRIKEYLTG